MEALLGFTIVGKPHSPLHTMTRCFDSIPIFYKGVVAVAEPLTRQTFLNTNVQTSLIASRTSSKAKHGRKIFLVYTYSVTQKLGPTRSFGPKDIQPMISRSFPGLQYEGMYTANNFLNFGSTSSLAQHQGTPFRSFPANSVYPPWPMTKKDEYGKRK